MSNLFKESKGSDLVGAELAAEEVDPWFVRQLNAALKSPLLVVPKPFETWMIDKVASSGFDLPISQIVGFAQFAAQSAPTIATGEATTSTTYVDLATVGPSLSGLPDGQYLILFGAGGSISTSTGNTARMSLSINAAAAADADMALAGGTNAVSMARAVTKTLNDGSNSIVAKYRSTDAGTSAQFENRWLVCLKYANA